jgi:IS30 family transposase
MIDFQSFSRIRVLHDEHHLSIAQIARELNPHPETVSRWVKRATYTQRSARKQRVSKLDPFKALIQQQLSSYTYKQWPEIFNHDTTRTAALMDRILPHV